MFRRNAHRNFREARIDCKSRSGMLSTFWQCSHWLKAPPGTLAGKYRSLLAWDSRVELQPAHRCQSSLKCSIDAAALKVMMETNRWILTPGFQANTWAFLQLEFFKKKSFLLMIIVLQLRSHLHRRCCSRRRCNRSTGRELTCHQRLHGSLSSLRMWQKVNKHFSKSSHASLITLRRHCHQNNESNASSQSRRVNQRRLNHPSSFLMKNCLCS